MLKNLIAYVDGASRGNPGRAAYGVRIEDAEGNVLMEISETIGVNTNNVAEYRALIRALLECRNMGAQSLRVYTDSQFVAKQFDGSYRVKHQGMKKLLAEVRELEASFKQVRVDHIPRSSHPGNKRADQLANIALDRDSINK